MIAKSLLEVSYYMMDLSIASLLLFVVVIGYTHMTNDETIVR